METTIVDVVDLTTSRPSFTVHRRETTLKLDLKLVWKEHRSQDTFDVQQLEQGRLLKLVCPMEVIHCSNMVRIMWPAAPWEAQYLTW